MNTPENVSSPAAPSIPNGSGAAAVLAAGIGCFVLAVLAFAGDKSLSIKNSLNFYKPTGPLSGITTVAILAWLCIWGLLEWRWRKQTVAASRVHSIALALLVLSILLTFPPIVDLL